jgi:hypothetical protein
MATSVTVPITNLDPGDPLRLFTPVSIITLLLVVIATHFPRVKIDARTVAGVGFLTAILLASILSPDLGAPTAWVLFCGPAVLMVLALSVLTDPEKDLVLRSLVVLAMLQLPLILAEQVLLDTPAWGAPVSPVTGTRLALPNELLGAAFARSQGTLGHPLPLSFLLTVAIAITTTHPGLFPHARAVICATLFGGLLLTGSRSALIIALLVVLAHLFATRSGPSKILLGIVGLVGLALLLTTLALPNVKFVSVFLQSGSVTHRVGAFEALPRLFTQDALSLVLGNGYLSVPRLFELGYLQLDGFAAVDNQFVSTLVQAGFAGLILLFVLLIVSFTRSAGSQRLVLLVLVAQMLVFDVVSWAAPLLLFFTVLMTVPRATGLSSGAKSSVRLEPRRASRP